MLRKFQHMCVYSSADLCPVSKHPDMKARDLHI